MFEADKITEKNKKQLFYEKGIYSKIFYPEATARIRERTAKTTERTTEKMMTAVRMTAAAAGITVMLGMTGGNRSRRRITIKANPKAEKTMCRRRLRFCCR